MSKYDSVRVLGYDPRCKKYTPNDYSRMIREECERLGLSFIGLSTPWLGTNKTKVVFACPVHGENSTTNVNRFLNQGVRCVKCKFESLGKSKAKGPDHWKRLLIEKCGHDPGIMVKMRNGVPWVWCPVCAQDDFSLSGVSDAWFKSPTGTIYYGGKSCRCSAKYKYKHEERIHLILKRCDALGYSFSPERHSNLKAKGKIAVSCPDHGEFESSVGNFLWLETICPQCAEYGYQKALPGVVYLLFSECGQYMKIGITNKMKSRLKGLRTNTPFGFKVAGQKHFEDGSEAREYELRLHSMFRPAGLSGFSGCTEWFLLDGSAVLYF
jgi:hypothetical protein